MSQNSLSIWLAASLWVGASGCETKKAAPSSAAPPAVESGPTSAQGGAPGACKPGFEAKGDKCVDIDECSFVASVCGTPQATCSNKPGGYECTCPRGYAGGGPLGIACTPRIVMGATASCALPEGGGVLCWGAKDGGVWITEFPDELSAAPAAIDLAQGAVSVALAHEHACILRDDSTVACWGTNGSGQLGDGKLAQRPYPYVVPGLDGVVQIAVGGEHTCAVRRDQSLLCWGSNKSGQLTSALPAQTSTPQTLNVGRVVSTVLGITHSCALLTNGKVICWGGNRYGELGRGDADPVEQSGTPRELDGLEQVRMMVENAALRADGSVMIWGRDDTRMEMTLDHVTGVVVRAPTRVAELQGIALISGDANGMCALNKDGKLWCRGMGPLGNGKKGNSQAPVLVDAGSKLLSLSQRRGCAIDGVAGLVCWGSNRFKRLGAKEVWVLKPTAISGVEVLASSAPP